MKRLTFILLALATVLQLGAVPAMRRWYTVTQSDGTELQVRQIGDEHFHYYITTDNVPLIDQPGKGLCYATASGFGISSTGVIAHEAAQRTDVERAAISDVQSVEAMRAYAMRFPMRQTRIRALSDAVSDSTAIDPTAIDSTMMGKRRALLILVNFSDIKFKDDSIAVENYTHMCNDSAWKHTYSAYGYQYNALGSVHDYFYAQSLGKFDISFDVVKVNLPKKSTYYGQNSNSWGESGDQYPRLAEFVMTACQKADSVAPELNWKQYDWNGDGKAELIFLLYAGGGEATSGGASTIWPHKFSFDDLNASTDYSTNYGFTSHDSTVVDVYACSNEVMGAPASKTKMGIGTICHEFSHCMGLPDLYDTRGGTASNLGDFDVLASGSYNSPDDHQLCWAPAGYSAYERACMNWFNYVTLDSTNANLQVDSLPSVANGGNAYVLYNDANHNEYFIVENRTQDGWDTYIPSQGITMMHIDYDPEIWALNIVNSTTYPNYNNHARVAFVPARKSYYSSIYTFPYNSIDSITDKSANSTKLYNNNKAGTKKLGLPIYNIKYDSQNGLASFLFLPMDTTKTDTTQNDTTKADSTKADTIKSDTTITAIRNINLKGASTVRIYTLNGTPVGSNLNNLPSGLYIVRREDGTTRKVAVK